jgi:hypothetical protein
MGHLAKDTYTHALPMLKGYSEANLHPAKNKLKRNSNMKLHVVNIKDCILKV